MEKRLVNLCKSVDSARNCLAELRIMFSFDTETDRSTQFATHQKDVISFSDDVLAFAIDLKRVPLEYIKHDIERVFSRATVVFVHNAVFDLGVLYRIGIDPRKFKHVKLIDTMILDHLIDENRQHGLKFLVEYFFGHKMKTYEEVQHASRNEYLRYAREDAVWTYDLAMKLLNISSPKITQLYGKVEEPFIWVLFDMLINGVKVDLDTVKATAERLYDLSNESMIKMLTLLGERVCYQATLTEGIIPISPINFNSPLQLAEIMFNRLGLEVIERTETGIPSVGTITLSELEDKHPFVAELRRYRAIRKLLVAFFAPLPSYVNEDGRVRPNFFNVGTVTGRLSCSNPNLQQLPKNNRELNIDTRSCFVASEGKKMVAVDYSQQELRIMAHLSKDERLIKVINEGGDLHLINANTVFDLGIPEEYCFTSHPKYEETKKKYYAERNKGKVFSFGIAYGMGPHKLSKDFRVSVQEAERLLDKFFKGFPGLKKAIDDTHYETKKYLSVSSLTGRTRHFVRNERGEVDFKSLRQAFNFKIQSFGADLLRMACAKVLDYANQYPNKEIKLLMSVHDELVLECNERYGEEVARVCEKLFQDCTPDGFAVSLKAEASFGNHYGEVK